MLLKLQHTHSKGYIGCLIAPKRIGEKYMTVLEENLSYRVQKKLVDWGGGASPSNKTTTFNTYSSLYTYSFFTKSIATVEAFDIRHTVYKIW